MLLGHSLTIRDRPAAGRLGASEVAVTRRRRTGPGGGAAPGMGGTAGPPGTPAEPRQPGLGALASTVLCSRAVSLSDLLTYLRGAFSGERSFFSQSYKLCTEHYVTRNIIPCLSSPGLSLRKRCSPALQTNCRHAFRYGCSVPDHCNKASFTVKQIPDKVNHTSVLLSCCIQKLHLQGTATW